MNQLIQRICLATVLVFAASGDGKAQETPASTKDWLKNNLIISYWCGPPSARTEEPLYQNIKDGGFNAAMPYHDLKEVSHCDGSLAELEKSNAFQLAFEGGDGRIFKIIK